MDMVIVTADDVAPAPPVSPTTATDTTFTIEADRDVVTARRQGRALAVRLGFSSMDATLVATAISELARNILLYATSGHVLLQVREEPGRQGIRIVASDHGPGIQELSRVISGGYSTSQGLGLGLCGVKRLMDEFDIGSHAGQGTTVTITKWLR